MGPGAGADREVRHETVVAAPVARVWHAWTTNEGLGTFDLWVTRPDRNRRQVLSKAANSEGWQKWCR
jgi:uncharacterized protein YndB with AHSA1/START domain